MTCPEAHSSKIHLQYLAGWSCHEPPDIDAEANLAAMTSAVESVLPNTSLHSPTATITTTDVITKSDNSSIFAISGSPKWIDPELAEFALRKGHAAALELAYEKEGDDCILKLQGPFSLAIYDTPDSTFLLATDKLGMCPVYFSITDRGVVFASSAAMVNAHEEVKANIEPQSIYNYVYFHMVASPQSIYTGVRRLQAGQALKYRSGTYKVSTYFVPEFHERTDRSFSQMGSALRDELKESVQRAIADENTTAAFLSGGLDSSSVVGMLAEVSDSSAHAFSIGFSAEGYDEMEYARLTARHFGVNLHEYYVTPEDVVEALPLVVESYDEPFGNSSALPAYFCAKVAAENGYKRLLAGDGGDELFGGNERYLKQNVFERYGMIPAFLRAGLIEPIVKHSPPSFPLISKARSYIEQANTPLPDRLQSYNFLHRHSAGEIFSAEFLKDVDDTKPLSMQKDIYKTPADGTSTLNRMMYLDWQYTLADNDLRKVSQMCAVAGIEVAYPMLDDSLIALSQQVPSNWKIRNRVLRHFYKEALRGWLPVETINKRKQGFGLPFGVWMKTHAPLRDMAYDSLVKLKKRSLFRPEFIDQTIDLHRDQHAAYYGELVWILMVLEIWLNKHGQQQI